MRVDLMLNTWSLISNLMLFHYFINKNLLTYILVKSLWMDLFSDISFGLCLKHSTLLMLFAFCEICLVLHLGSLWIQTWSFKPLWLLDAVALKMLSNVTGAIKKNGSTTKSWKRLESNAGCHFSLINPQMKMLKLYSCTKWWIMMC